MSDKEDVETIRSLRVRLEGGKMSDVEHDSLEKLIFDLTKALIKNSSGRKLAVQAMCELIFASIAFDSTTKEEFYKGVYNLAKDYIFPQADKFGEFLVNQRLEQINNPEKAKQIIKDYKKLEEQQQGIAHIIEGNLDEVIAELEALATADDCPCPNCVARRERKGKEEPSSINPNPNTKH